MIAAIALLLALQADPTIEKVERVIGDVNRPLVWTPLRVTLTSASDFSGDVSAKSGFGFSVARAVRIKAGGREVVLLPALDPAEVVAGKSVFKLPRDFRRPDRIVLVDDRLPYAGDLASTAQVLFQKIPAEDLEKMLPRGLLEAADLVLLKEPVSGGAGVVAPAREDADRALASLGEGPASLELVDRPVWPLAPQGGWVPAKKNWTLYFATVYAFAGFLALAVLARRFPRAGAASLAGVAALGLCGFAFFPRSQMWIEGRTVEVVGPRGDAVLHRVWFLQAALETTPQRIDFPRLVKPIFPTTAGSDDAFTIRAGERGCTVEGLRLLPGMAACFGGTEGTAASMKAADRVSQPLRMAVLVRGGRTRYLGTLSPGDPVPAEVGEGSAPRSGEFEAWKRFVGTDGLFGVSSVPESSAGDVRSADLADQHDHPRVFIRRFR